MIATREWREPATELNTAVSEVMRLCVNVAEDLHVCT